jgi:hypothetical protein
VRRALMPRLRRTEPPFDSCSLLLPLTEWLAQRPPDIASGDYRRAPSKASHGRCSRSVARQCKPLQPRNAQQLPQPGCRPTVKALAARSSGPPDLQITPRRR